MSKEEIERIEAGVKPVALPDRLPVRMPEGRNLPKGYAEAWNDCIAEIEKLGPLFTRSDAGEAESRREELAELEDEFDTLEHSNISLKLALQAAEQRNAELVKLLRIMTGDYARCLEAGYDRITFLGGDCDSVEKMLNDNPNYAKAIAALKPAESGASNEQ